LVWLAKKRGSKKPLAVKMMIASNASVQDGEDFLLETETMAKLGAHPNITSLIGVSFQEQPWLVAIEFMKYGDLLQVVQTCREKKLLLRPVEMLYLMTQIASGMRYIAALRLVHMDLAARNCLLGDNSRVKVADFGLTHAVPKGKKYWRLTQKMKLPVKWMSTEAMQKHRFSEMSDVWAFGVTCWEISSYGSVPYTRVPLLELKDKVCAGLRLQKWARTPQGVYALFDKCWAADPDARPKFKKLNEKLLTLGQAEMKKRGDKPDFSLRDIGHVVRSTMPGCAAPKVAAIAWV
jgi:serine/threonine protein kinase